MPDCGDNVRTSYWLRGSINDEQLVLWVFQCMNQIYWASVVEDVSGELNIVATKDITRASVFTMFSTPTSLQLSIYHNGILYYVSGTEAETGMSIAQLSTNAQWLSMSTSEIDPTSDITTGVNYLGSFFGQNLGVKVNESELTETENEFVFMFRVIPTIVYPLGSCGDPVTDINEIKRIEDNWAMTNKSVSDYFTSNAECFNGAFYNYCRVGEGCSTLCKGTCSLGELCEYNVSNRSWTCVDPLPPNNEGSEFTRPRFWFILAMIILIMSVIAIAIGVYQYTTRNVKNVDSPTTSGQEIYLEPQQLATTERIMSERAVMTSSVGQMYV